jgi:hypothetical protein
MAFPGTMNITYYKGDTYEFRIYPKKSDGTPYNLLEFEHDAGTLKGPKFTIAPTRGLDYASNPAVVKAYVSISADNTYLTCAIRPGDGNLLNSTVQYVYDIQIVDGRSGNTDLQPYDKVITVLTGIITVVEDVTNPSLES